MWLDVGVGHEQRLPHKGQAPGRVKEGTRNSSYLVAGWIQDRDLIGADQGDVGVARLRERNSGGLWKCSVGADWKAVDQLEVG